MNQERDRAAGGDSSEETVVSAPRFDGRAEERARPVVPLGDADETTRVRGASAGGRRPGVAGPKNFRRYAPVILPLVALLAAVALAVQQRGRSGDAQSAQPPPETPAVVAAPPGREEAAGRDGGDRDNSRRAVRRGREEGGGDDRGRDGWWAEGRGDGRGGEGKGEREGRGKGRDKEVEERIKKEREKHRERAKEAEKEFKRLKELFKDN